MSRGVRTDAARASRRWVKSPISAGSIPKYQRLLFTCRGEALSAIIGATTSSAMTTVIATPVLRAVGGGDSTDIASRYSTEASVVRCDPPQHPEAL